MNDIIVTSSTALGDTFNYLHSIVSLDLAFKTAIVYGLVIWLATIIWVIKDVTNRSTNILLHVLAVLIVIILTPIFGLPIYFLIRPNTTLFEQYYEETSLEALSEDKNNTAPDEKEEGIAGIYKDLSCPHCLESVDTNHHYCPHCGKELMVKCIHCKTSMNGSWKFCPNCGKNQVSIKKKKEDLLVEEEKSSPPSETDAHKEEET